MFAHAQVHDNADTYPTVIQGEMALDALERLPQASRSWRRRRALVANHDPAPGASSRPGRWRGPRAIWGFFEGLR
jgi:hypothetical protein